MHYFYFLVGLQKIQINILFIDHDNLELKIWCEFNEIDPFGLYFTI